ncbi:MAG: arylamine N-acetyltransferase [Opitutaceae bacterium]|jgi:N-hydroxyarylamine O-acetyltransferase
MQPFAPDLAAYFNRISFSGKGDASLDTLREIQRRHLLAVPFENLDVIAGKPIPLDGASLERKLVHERRGGYCFENNSYLILVLRALGFSVTPHLARVRWKVPAGATVPRAHLVLSVEADGHPWLFDVGFGGLGLNDVIALDSEEGQPTHDGQRRIQKSRHGLIHQIRAGEAWADVYEISAEPAIPIDWEVANWFTSTHPQSRFRNNLVVARSSPEGRCAILNRELTVRRGDSLERRALGGPDELLACLREYFGLSFPPGTRFGQPGGPWPA